MYFLKQIFSFNLPSIEIRSEVGATIPYPGYGAAALKLYDVSYAKMWHGNLTVQLLIIMQKKQMSS